MRPLARRLPSSVPLMACLAVHTLGMASRAATQEVPVSAQDMPICKEEDVAYQRWLEARTVATGIRASSADKFLIPTATASDDCNGAVDLSLNQSGRFDDGVHAWIAAARCKEAVCGTPDESPEPFCGGAFWTGECDININILAPKAARVTSLLERHQCLGDTVGLRQDLAREGGTLCFDKSSDDWLFHAESTAPRGKARDALKAAWASQAEYDVWLSSLSKNKEMCVYGPIVGDTGHGLKAEVHPVNMYWWTRRTPESHFAFGGPYDLLMIQDASGRYGNEFGYVINESFPENRVWRPWSQAPLVGQFEIPVWVRKEDVVEGTCASETRHSTSPAPAAKPVTFRVEPWKACKEAPTITDELKIPPDDLKPLCVSRSAPRLYVEVAAKNTYYEKFDVSADWTCRCETPLCETPGYLGYLRVDGRVGLDRDFWEGALGLTVVDTRLDPAVTKPPECVAKKDSEKSREESRKAASQPESDGKIEARVRRILTSRSGREQEDFLDPPPPGSTLDVLLAEIRWPDSLMRPPVERILRPKEIRLDVATRIHGLGEEGIEVDIAKVWTVDVSPLPLARDTWKTVVNGKRDDQVKVRLPQMDRPYKIRATVDLTPPAESGVKKPDQIQHVLWTDRLALKPSEIEAWIEEMIEEMSRLCDAPVRAREEAPNEAAEQLPVSVRNLLSEASRRREVTMTTLAILADLKNRNCPPPEREQKMMLR